MDINDLRRQRKAAADLMAEKATAITELQAAETPDQSAIEAAMAEFAAAETDFKSRDEAVKRAEAVEAAQAAAATSEINAPASGTATPPLPAAAQNPDEEAVDVGMMVAALANHRGDREAAAEQLEQAGHSGISAALSGASDGAGGVTVPRAMSQRIITLLQPRITVRRMGAVVHDMPAGELRNARIASAPNASYGSENGMIVESEPTFDKVDQKFKTLTSLVPMGNALLRHSSASVGRVVRDLMLQQMGLKSDIGFIRYDGSGDLPKGLRHWAPGANWQTGVGNGVAAVEAAINQAVSVVEDANVMMLKPGWIMRASTKNFLASLRDPNSGAKIYPEIDAKGELKGYPIGVTSQVPNNLGVGSNETEVTFCDFAEIMIGESQDITVSTSTEAAYVDVNGDTISAYQNNLTLMRAVAEHDLAPMHDVAISGITGVNWTLGA